MKMFKYLLLVSVAAGLMVACGGSGAGKKAEMEAEDVAVSFCRAVAGGDFEKAMILCDTLTMKGYIREQEAAWHMLEKSDSSAYMIATQMLSQTEMTVDEVIKEGDRRQVFCSISFEGKTKEKVMTLQKEEGGWKVTAISDRN